MSLLLTLIEVVACGEYAHTDKVASRDVGDIGDRQTDVMTPPPHPSTGRVGQQSVLSSISGPRIFILFGKAKSDLSAQFYHHRDLSIGRFGTGLVSNLVLNCIIGVPSLFSVEMVLKDGHFAICNFS